MKAFISHSQCDEHVASSIARELEIQGVKVWLAPRRLSPGERLSKIHKHIESSDFVVVILSKSSLNSRWVRHEMNTAIALSLGGNPVRVVPVTIDKTPLPTEVADLVVIDMQSNKYADGLARLVATVTGEVAPPASIVEGFAEYIRSLVPLDEKVCYRVAAAFSGNVRAEAIARGETEEAFRAEVETRESLGIRERTRDSIAQRLAETNISKDDTDRILAAFDDCRPFAGIAQQDKEDLIAWVRTANETILTLAADLYALVLRGKRGVTLNWFCARCKRNSSEASLRTVEWQAEQLVDQGKKAGLLTRSTEYLRPGTYAARDAETNPGYDLGPMLYLAGRHFLCYRSAAVDSENAADG